MPTHLSLAPCALPHQPSQLRKTRGEARLKKQTKTARLIPLLTFVDYQLLLPQSRAGNFMRRAL